MYKITWLGQAGLLFENMDKDLTIMIDPHLSNKRYCSDSCRNV